MIWEYKTLVLLNEIGIDNAESLEQKLNELGEQGWELVNIIPQIASDSDSSYGDVDINITCCEEVYVNSNVCLFKRKKVIDEE